MKHYKADIMVCGGGLGGYAAAWAAVRYGRTVVLSEETDRLGGQLTAQAVPPDEHPWIEWFGATQSYRQVRKEIRQHYRRYYPLSAKAIRSPFLNPGDGSVSPICHEPRVSQSILDSFLASSLAGGKLTILYKHVPVKAAVTNETVEAVTLQHVETGEQCIVTADYYIDASELGDLLPLTDTDFVMGAESRNETKEPHASAEANPLNQQAISWCYAISYHPDEDNTIEKPQQYNFWRNYVPDLTPGWGGRLLSWNAIHPITLQSVRRHFDPLLPQPKLGPMDLWTFRRIASQRNFISKTYNSDIVLVNWPQIDYMLGPVVGVSEQEKLKHFEGARQLSLSMLYWMQTEAPRDDGKIGWPGLKLRGDVTGTEHGLAAYPYIRESRRIRGLFTVLEQHVSAEYRSKRNKGDYCDVAAHQFEDSVGVGAYRIDLHPSTGGDNYIDIGSLPFQIPLGSLIPRSTKNLLAGGKTLSVTHITNGCYRLHPVEWNIGESAALCAVFCLEQKSTPHELHATKSKLDSFQNMLTKEGIELAWPKLPAL